MGVTFKKHVIIYRMLSSQCTGTVFSEQLMQPIVRFLGDAGRILGSFSGMPTSKR